MTQMYHAITKHTHTHTHTLFIFFLKKKERERMWRGYMSHPVSSIVISLNNKQTKKGGCVWCDSVCVCVCVCVCVQWGKKKKKQKRVWSDYIGRATNRRPFTGAIPLLRDTETFACCVSTLGRFVSP